MTDLQQFWETRYDSGHTPWDTGITPPEVKAFWAQGHMKPQGLALDLGCGTGTNTLFLARLGLRAIGVDIAYRALSRAQDRRLQAEPPVRDRLQFVLADVTQLPLWHAGIGYVLDVGCFHGVGLEVRDDYAKGLINNVRPGGFYQLYAFDQRPAPNETDTPTLLGISQDEIVRLLTPAFRIVSAEQAMPAPFPCHWYLLQRQ